MGGLLGYARVSTSEQNPAGRLDALRAAGVERVWRDVGSGVRADRPALRAMLAAAVAGDTVVVTRLDRLARSLPDLLSLVEDSGARDRRASGCGPLHGVQRSLVDPRFRLPVRVGRAHNAHMPRDDDPAHQPVVVDTHLRPNWMRTGYKFFPYAAQVSGQWWVLRFNYDFPEHDMYTLFVDGSPGVDITAGRADARPLVSSIFALKPFRRDDGEPTLAPELAEQVVRPVAGYVVYGSEVNDPCDRCRPLPDDPPARR